MGGPHAERRASESRSVRISADLRTRPQMMHHAPRLISRGRAVQMCPCEHRNVRGVSLLTYVSERHCPPRSAASRWKRSRSSFRFPAHSGHQEPLRTGVIRACHMCPRAHCQVSFDLDPKYCSERQRPPCAIAISCACSMVRRCRNCLLLSAQTGHHVPTRTEADEACHVCPAAHCQVICCWILT